MIVNINQCASMYDETLNVLKFSAVAQKVYFPANSYSLPLLWSNVKMALCLGGSSDIPHYSVMLHYMIIISAFFFVAYL